MNSVLAKKISQTPLSRPELRRNGQIGKLKRIVRDCELYAVDEASREFGGMFARRLKKSAKRSGRSIVGYVADVLVA